jgi:predicted metalloprotease with PDZ domain
MRGVNLNVFEFDFDLTWAAFFLDADQRIYGRYGGRDASSADKYLTLAGLKHAMRSALEAHARAMKNKTPPPPPPAHLAVEEYPAAKRLKAGACIHCHQVWDFRREKLRAEKLWTRDQIWVYPLPESIGLSVDPDAGNRVTAVRTGSPAAAAGLKAGDVLLRVASAPTASFADVQHALHKALADKAIEVIRLRDGGTATVRVTPAAGWRESDISWRASMWGLEPAAAVYGRDLTAEEKAKLGLSEKALAFRQGGFVPAAARQAGIRQNDIILGIDGRKLEMTMLQFNAWVRLNHKVGDKVSYNIIRDGKRMDLPGTLPARPF